MLEVVPLLIKATCAIAGSAWIFTDITLKVKEHDQYIKERRQQMEYSKKQEERLMREKSDSKYEKLEKLKLRYIESGLPICKYCKQCNIYTEINDEGKECCFSEDGKSYKGKCNHFNIAGGIVNCKYFDPLPFPEEDIEKKEEEEE